MMLVGWVGSFSPGLPTTNPTDKLLFSSMPRNEGIFRSYLHRINQTFSIYMNFTRKEGFFFLETQQEKETSDQKPRIHVCSGIAHIMVLCCMYVQLQCVRKFYSQFQLNFTCVYFGFCLVEDTVFGILIEQFAIWSFGIRCTVYVCTTEALTGQQNSLLVQLDVHKTFRRCFIDGEEKFCNYFILQSPVRVALEIIAPFIFNLHFYLVTR